MKEPINSPDSSIIIPSIYTPSSADAKEQGRAVVAAILKKRLSFAVATLIY